MKERCLRDQEFSRPFSVEWLKVVHMPFMIYDRPGMFFPLPFISIVWRNWIKWKTERRSTRLMVAISLSGSGATQT